MRVYDSCSDVIAMLAARPEGFSGIFRRMGYVALLPLLRLPHQLVSRDLPQALAEFGMSKDEAEQISLSALVAFALRSSSEFWVGRAIGWISDGFPVTVEILKAGDQMIAYRRGTRSKHPEFRRLLRRWERNTFGSLYQVRLSLLRVLRMRERIMDDDVVV